MASLFTRIAPETARLYTLLHRAAGRSGVGAAGGAWRLEWLSDGAAAAPGVALYGTLGSGEFTVWLDDPDWRLAAARALETPPDQVAALPEPLVRAGLVCFADEALAGVEKAVGAWVAVARVEMNESPPPSSACRFRLTGEDGLRIGGAWVLADAGGRARGALEKCLSALPVPSRELPDGLPLDAVVAVALGGAPAAALDGLAPGDVVLSPAGAERELLVGGRLRFAARLENGVLAVEGKTMTEAKKADAKAPAPEAGPEDLARLEEVEVELQAQVGRLVVTLAQLRQLGAGQVVEFSTPVESPATLTVGGRAIATGELVDVGGRVGVRITALAE